MSNFFKRSQKMKQPNKPDRDVSEKQPGSSSGFFKRKSTKSVEPSVQSDKKPFDKKLYRLKKYSNKYKLQQWETKRKEKVSREYTRQTKNDPKIDVQKIYEQDSDNEMDNDNNVNTDIQQNKPSSSGGTIEEGAKKKFKKAYLQFDDKQEEKKQRKELLEKQKAEKKAALEEYKKKKVEKFKKLNKKTKRGQPVMAGRMEILLEEIQNSMKN